MSTTRTSFLRTWCMLTIVTAGAGCANPVRNRALVPCDPRPAYRFSDLRPGDRNSNKVFVVLALSGGGTRAAALSYGALKALRTTTLLVDGSPRSLLDEVDVISTVSGGSFTGSYYALKRDKIFEEYEQRVLFRDMEHDIKWAAFKRLGWVRWWRGQVDRTDAAADLYDQTIFSRASYADLLKNGTRPFLIVNACDVSRGTLFHFTQEYFDLLGSDLTSFPLSRAVTASSAFPVGFNPVALANFQLSDCKHEPAWVDEALTSYDADPQRYLAAREYRAFYARDPRTRYVHLTDGGVADNLGVRVYVDGLLTAKPSECLDLMCGLPPEVEKEIRRVVVVVVNARGFQPDPLGQAARAPSITAVLAGAASIGVDNQTNNAVDLIRWAADHRQQATGVPHHVIEVNMVNVKDPDRRRRLLEAPTRFVLPKETVADVIAAGEELVRAAPAYAAARADLAAR